MSIKPPFTELEINKAPSGFYEGNSVPIALISKGIMARWSFGRWFSSQCKCHIGQLELETFEGFNSFYIVIVGLFLFFLAIVAIVPSTGKRVMDCQGKSPSFPISRGFR